MDASPNARWVTTTHPHDYRFQAVPDAAPRRPRTTAERPCTWASTGAVGIAAVGTGAAGIMAAREELLDAKRHPEVILAGCTPSAASSCRKTQSFTTVAKAQPRRRWRP